MDAHTTAQQIADALDNDGQRWTTRDGIEFDALITAHGGATVERRDSDQASPVRYTFRDGSVITAAGEAWDLGFPSCFCWQGNPDCAQH